jgi:hypothetical protein
MNFMNNRNLLRGIFLSAVALAFGLGALRYPLGVLGRAGPGLFPLMVSIILLLIGITTIVRALLVERVPMPMYYRSIVIVLISLGGFALISTYAGMLVGTVFMTFCSGLAGTFSWLRSAIIAAALVAIALALQYGLGLNMPLMPGFL